MHTMQGLVHSAALNEDEHTPSVKKNPPEKFRIVAFTWSDIYTRFFLFALLINAPPTNE